MEYQCCNLNIRYDLPPAIWDKVPLVYQQMRGWLGFGKDGKGETGFPYWFGYNETKKHITASVEPSGLQFFGCMEEEEWLSWKADLKLLATNILGFKVGELEEGEVSYEIEWINKEETCVQI